MQDTAALLAIDQLRIVTGIESKYITPSTMQLILSDDDSCSKVKHWTSSDCLLGDTLIDTLEQAAENDPEGHALFSCDAGKLHALFVSSSILNDEYN